MICHLSPYTINHLHDAKCVKFLGKGSFGKVRLYKCLEQHEDCKCDKLFVVKQLCISLKKKEDAILTYKKIRKYLINEYTIGTLLCHPCIRETLDVDFTKMSIIFEYCPGINFYTYLQTNSKKDALYYFKQFVDGVNHMHTIGIAHMDLKLENIMIDTLTRKLKIIDFGESRVFHDCNKFILEKGIHGSMPYIAPEEFTEKEYNPEKADIWSVLIILYEILYNTLPWQSAEITNCKYKKFHTLFKLNKELLPNIFFKDEFIDLFKHGLNPDPNIRCNINYIKSIIDTI